MHHAQRRIAGRYVIHGHAHRAQVVEFFHGHLFLLHLPPDAVDVFRAATDLGVDAMHGQFPAQGRLHAVDVAFAPVALFIQLSGHMPIGVRLQIAEGQVFQLPLQLPDAQAIGQRGMDISGQLRQRLSLGGRQAARCTHARQLPGQQDGHHAQVVDDGQQQTAQPFAVTSNDALRVQGPDLGGGVLAFQQADDACLARELRLHQRLQARHAEKQCGQQHVTFRRQPDQCLKCVDQHRPDIGHARRAAWRLQTRYQRRPQWCRQCLGRTGLQPVFQ